jgi:tRNA (adenine22-N1)-methyltransferase
MKPKTALDARLRAAAEYVRQEAYFADIGTDHAYLPVFLIEEGRISHAIAADIAKGPLARAAETVREAGLEKEIELCLTDGLQGLADRGVTDIAICGMGGEMIASILEASPFVKDASIRLILQPMTRAAHLRYYLAREGFAVEEETLCQAGRKLYSCLCASYTGTPYTLTPAEAEVGYYHIHRGASHPLFSAYLRHHIDTISRRVSGMLEGGQDPKETQTLLTELETIYDSQRTL